MKQPTMRGRLTIAGRLPIGSTPAETAAVIDKESAGWDAGLRATGAQVQ